LSPVLYLKYPQLCESEEAASVASVDGPVIEPTTNLVLHESTDVMVKLTGVMQNRAGDEEFQVYRCFIKLERLSWFRVLEDSECWTKHLFQVLYFKCPQVRESEEETESVASMKGHVIE